MYFLRITFWDPLTYITISYPFDMRCLFPEDFSLTLYRQVWIMTLLPMYGKWVGLRTLLENLNFNFNLIFKKRWGFLHLAIYLFKM